MKMREVARRSSVPQLVGVLAIAAVLMGCSGGADDDELPPKPFDSVAMPIDTAPVATPGQHLGMGEIAVLPQSDFDGVPLDAIETTVVGVVQGDRSYWDGFDNGAQFEESTPFFAVMQYRWVTGEAFDSRKPLLRPVLNDGTEGDIVKTEQLSMTTDSDCPFEVKELDFDEGRGPEEFITCVVYAAPIGSTLAGLGWHNEGGVFFSEPDPALNPFFAIPVIWDVTPIAAPDGD
jgi:hypothetical protein